MPQYNRGLRIIINDVALEYNPDIWLEIAEQLPTKNKVRHFSARRKRDLSKRIKHLMGVMNDCYYRI